MRDSVLIYRTMWILERIYEVSERLRNLVVDSTHFEERCIRRLSRYIKEDDNRINHRQYIERLIQMEASDYISRSKEAPVTLFGELMYKDEEDDEVEFDPEDVSANVESDVIAKEMTALLAQDDHRKKEILGYWTIGNTNHAYISRALARSFGGNTESHRRAINRFREDCRELLSFAAVKL